jgi:hypothetical protein
MTKRPERDPDAPPPSTPGKPVEHASRQQRTHDDSDARQDAREREHGDSKPAPNGATPPGPK